MCALGSTSPPTTAQGAGPPVIGLRGAETLGIGVAPSKADTARVDADLLALHAEYQAHLTQRSRQGATAPAFQSSNTIAPIAGGSVVIDTAASGDPEALAADLRALGADKLTVFGHVISARPADHGHPGAQGLVRLAASPPRLCGHPGRRRDQPGGRRDACGPRSHGLRGRRHRGHGGHAVGQLQLSRRCRCGRRDRRSARRGQCPGRRPLPSDR